MSLSSEEAEIGGGPWQKASSNCGSEPDLPHCGFKCFQSHRHQVVAMGSAYPWRWVAVTPETRGYHLFPGKEVSLAGETCYEGVRIVFRHDLICKVVPMLDARR